MFDKELDVNSLPNRPDLNAFHFYLLQQYIIALGRNNV